MQAVLSGIQGRDMYGALLLPLPASRTFCLTRCIGGTRLGDYFSVYLTGLEDSPDQDPASTSSTEAPTPTPGKRWVILAQ